MIDCVIELDLSWSNDCIISGKSVIPPEVRRDNSAAAIQTTEATFQMNNVKLYVTVVTLSINDNVKYLENIKRGFKRTISWKTCCIVKKMIIQQ